jgi:hypothetical protein
MNTERFDTLVRTLTARAGPRRAALRLLATLPLVSPFAALLEDGHAATKGRRHRKQQHRRDERGARVQDERKKKKRKKTKVAAPALPPASPPLVPPECTTAATCPAPPASLLCAQATCINGKCGIGPKAASTVCRPVAGECDVAEQCDGTSLDCPANQFRPANTPCTNDGNPCTRDVCNGSSADCTHLPEPLGTPCATDFNICTQDICNGAGACTHPQVPNGTSCGASQVCCSPAGICCPAGIPCTNDRCCRPPGASCSDGRQCCSNSCLVFVCSP